MGWRLTLPAVLSGALLISLRSDSMDVAPNAREGRHWASLRQAGVAILQKATRGPTRLEISRAIFGQVRSYAVFGRPAFLFHVALVLNAHVEFYESFVVRQEELTNKDLIILVQGGFLVMRGR